MSEEEKEAIEMLKTVDTIDLRETEQDLEEDFNNAIDIALNLIEKLQKENEMLKSKRQLEIDIAQEVLRWKGKYHLLSRRMEEEK